MESESSDSYVKYKQCDTFAFQSMRLTNDDDDDDDRLTEPPDAADCASPGQPGESGCLATLESSGHSQRDRHSAPFEMRLEFLSLFETPIESHDASERTCCARPRRLKALICGSCLESQWRLRPGSWWPPRADRSSVINGRCVLGAPTNQFVALPDSRQ